MKSTFVEFYDIYLATATEAASRLDGHPMRVSGNLMIGRVYKFSLII